MLFLYRRDLGDPYRDCPLGVVWFDNLRDGLGNVRIPLARNPCGRRRLKNLGPDVANSRYQRWIALNIRIVIACRYPCMPLFVSLSAVGLHTFGLEGVVVCGFSQPMVSGRPVRVCASRLVWIHSLCHPLVGDVECVCQPGSPRV